MESSKSTIITTFMIVSLPEVSAEGILRGRPPRGWSVGHCRGAGEDRAGRAEVTGQCRGCRGTRCGRLLPLSRNGRHHGELTSYLRQPMGQGRAAQLPDAGRFCVKRRFMVRRSELSRYSSVTTAGSSPLRSTKLDDRQNHLRDVAGLGRLTEAVGQAEWRDALRDGRSA